MEKPDPSLGEADRRQLEALAALARELGGRGWTPATSGNYSVRLDDRRIAVTRSGTDKRHLGVDDLMLVDRSGAAIAGGRPSAETLLHTQLYDRFPEARAVLHVHSPAATVASRHEARNGLIRFTNYELLKAFDGVTTHEVELTVPVLPNRQDMAALAALAAARLDEAGTCYAYLIEGHGVYAWGSDLPAAARHLEAIDFLLSCHLEERRLHP